MKNIRKIFIMSSLKQLKLGLQNGFNNCDNCKWACEYIDYILNLMEDKYYENL